MSETMRKFMEEVEKDAALAEALGKAETPEAVIALAAEKGFALTAEELKADESGCELEDDELDDVAGGLFWGADDSTGFGGGLLKRLFRRGKKNVTRADDLVYRGGDAHLDNLIYSGGGVQASNLIYSVGGGFGSDDKDDKPYLVQL